MQTSQCIRVFYETKRFNSIEQLPKVHVGINPLDHTADQDELTRTIRNA